MQSSYRHNDSKHFMYEKVKKPYFGSWKKAIHALQNTKIDVISEEQYLDYIKDNYPGVYENLEWI